MKVSCHYCATSLPKSAPRLLLDGHWTCEDCAYLIEHNPNARRIEKPPKVDPKHPQVEELFG